MWYFGDLSNLISMQGRMTIDFTDPRDVNLLFWKRINRAKDIWMFK